MATTVQSIIDRVADTLNDPTHARWDLKELVEFLSDAQRAAVLLKPEVNPKVANHLLESGSLQGLPSDAYMLIDVTRNINVNGNVVTAGRVITPTDRSSLDQSTPNWHVLSTVADVLPKNFIYDSRNRLHFYIYPARAFAATDHIEIIYAKEPAVLALDNNNMLAADLNIELGDIYVPALIHYVLHRAYEKEIPVVGQGPAMSQLHFQTFAHLITGQESEANENALTIRHEIGEKDE